MSLVGAEAGGAPSFPQVPVSSCGLATGLVEVLLHLLSMKPSLSVGRHPLERLVQNCCTPDTPVLPKVFARCPAVPLGLMSSHVHLTRLHVYCMALR